MERAAELGVIAALDDRPRAGRDPVITAEAKIWLVALACRKAKELGYPHELWTTRLLAAQMLRHIRVSSKHELKERLMAFIDDINREPVVHTWRYKIDNAA
jgi:hypothetical protein